VSKKDIAKEIGNVEMHMKDYPLIKMFKLNKLDQWPSLENLKKYYSATLSKNYPLL
jgi:hypothetical protein